MHISKGLAGFSLEVMINNYNPRFWFNLEFSVFQTSLLGAVLWCKIGRPSLIIYLNTLSVKIESNVCIEFSQKNVRLETALPDGLETSDQKYIRSYWILAK